MLSSQLRSPLKSRLFIDADIRDNQNIPRASGLILGLRPANERRRYKVTPSLIGWAQT